jgi:hypothetical protein
MRLGVMNADDIGSLISHPSLLFAQRTDQI